LAIFSLLVEPAVVTGLGGFLVALDGEPVLLLAGDLVLLDQVLGRRSHADAAQRVDAVGPAVKQRAVAHLEALPPAVLEQVWNGAHAVHAADDDGLAVAQPNRL